MSDPIVVVKQGKLRGAIVKSILGRDFLSFKGIPYAQPPVGDRRFKEPQPAESWTGVRDAVKEGPKCAQIDLISRKFEGQDDCLYLNVATTSLTGSRPVMFWIHGGGFVSGHGGDDLYGPDYLLEKDIVFVSINYRLATFGFLNLGNATVSGNMGLKDQTMALRWVKENIEYFGGDPNNVTIFGESAGGASVHLHTLSPLSKGLFHKAIAQSGVSVNPWAVSLENLSWQVVSKLGKDTTDPDEALKFLRNIPCQKIIEAQYLVMISKECGALEMRSLVGPTVDSSSPAPFLPQHPRELFNNGVDVPFMLGDVDAEGIILLTNVFGNGIPNLESNFEFTVPRDMMRDNPSKTAAVSEQVKKLYFGDGPISNKHLDSFVRCLSDIYFTIGIHKVAKVLVNKNQSSYLYRFGYRAKSNIARRLFQIDLNGTMHFEEIAYLFYSSEYPDLVPAPGSVERKLTDQMVAMWTNFAKTGNPTPKVDDLIPIEWLPMGNGVFNYLDIGAELKPGVNPSKEIVAAWDRILESISKK